MFVVLEGNLSEGFDVTGPFEKWEVAEAYRREQRKAGVDRWIVEVVPPMSGEWEKKKGDGITDEGDRNTGGDGGQPG